MNSAYDNSPLRSELTPHPRRPPEGGIYRVGIFSQNHDFCRGFFHFGAGG
jgi:hypothetical protein